MGHGEGCYSLTGSNDGNDVILQMLAVEGVTLNKTTEANIFLVTFENYSKMLTKATPPFHGQTATEESPNYFYISILQ